MLLTPQRLQKLATWENLSDSWYLVATVTLTVCNRPQEIPKLYHYALHTQNTNENPSSELYEKISGIVDKFEDINATGKDIGFNPYSRYNCNESFFQTSDKLRESILKTAALSGLPKAINSMMILKNSTPIEFQTKGNNREKIKNWEDYQQVQKRGKEYWNKVYTKISSRVENQMSSSYNDLWTYTIEDVYSPLLSFNEILTPNETSLVVIASLIPQDVNPQLKGHLKGAVNSGVAISKLKSARDMSILISKWCGITWFSEVANV